MSGEITGFVVNIAQVGNSILDTAEFAREGKKAAATMQAAGTVAAAALTAATIKHPLVGVASVFLATRAAKIAADSKSNGTTVKEEFVLAVIKPLDSWLTRARRQREQRAVIIANQKTPPTVIDVNPDCAVPA